jgi:hypothetical protein
MVELAGFIARQRFALLISLGREKNQIINDCENPKSCADFRHGDALAISAKYPNSPPVSDV